MIENVRGILDAIFEDYRKYVAGQIAKLGYKADWRLLNASDYGVPQLRPRVVFVAIRKEYAPSFEWPTPHKQRPMTVGETLFDLMSLRGWRGAPAWRERANEIAPTIVGGSKKHGGPDLGPTRAKKAWAGLGVDGHNIAENPPEGDFVRDAASYCADGRAAQGFPDSWIFTGKKTPAYRQVGNAFPPPVACAVAAQLYACLSASQRITSEA